MGRSGGGASRKAGSRNGDARCQCRDWTCKGRGALAQKARARWGWQESLCTAGHRQKDFQPSAASHGSGFADSHPLLAPEAERHLQNTEVSENVSRAT